MDVFISIASSFCSARSSVLFDWWCLRLLLLLLFVADDLSACRTHTHTANRFEITLNCIRMLCKQLIICESCQEHEIGNKLRERVHQSS